MSLCFSQKSPVLFTEKYIMQCCWFFFSSLTPLLTVGLSCQCHPPPPIWSETLLSPPSSPPESTRIHGFGNKTPLPLPFALLNSKSSSEAKVNQKEQKNTNYVNSFSSHSLGKPKPIRTLLAWLCWVFWRIFRAFVIDIQSFEVLALAFAESTSW